MEIANRNGEIVCKTNGQSCSDKTLPRAYCHQEQLDKSTARASWAPTEVPDTLSEADAAASRTGLDMIQYTLYAIEVVERLKAHNEQFQTHCPKAEMIGVRPPRHPNWLLGSRCEAWQARYSVMLQNMVMQPFMEAVEWSSGSSTLFSLGLVNNLTSIENYAPWLATLRKRLPPQFAARWTGVAKPEHSASMPRYRKYGIKAETVTHGMCCAQYGAYIEGAPSIAPRRYDIVSVDGRARADCIMHTLEAGLLQEEGGMLVLDNSERDDYNRALDAVPKWGSP